MVYQGEGACVLMKMFKRGHVLSAVVVLGLFAAGCQSNGSGNALASGEQTGSGMYCPKCETVWIRQPSRTGRVNLWRSEARMTCPDCDAMAKSRLMSDGTVMLHECPTCKVTPKVLSPGDHALHGKGPHTR